MIHSLAVSDLTPALLSKVDRMSPEVSGASVSLKDTSTVRLLRAAVRAAREDIVARQSSGGKVLRLVLF
jgi:hypothetical protein